MSALAPFLDAIRPGGDKTGFLQSFDDHAVAFVDQGPKQLVVTFDNLAEIGDKSPARGPWSYDFFAQRGASVLGIIARRGTWFRDASLIAYLQGLSDQGFFNGFDRVLMTGNSMGGFGALAFAPLAPGCNVLAFSPQTTLDKRIVPWEERYKNAWGVDWTLPYSDAAIGAEAAGPSWLIHDPLVAPDKRHADRITAPQFTKLDAWFASHKSPVFLRRLGILTEISERAMDGSLAPARFHDLYRARRTTPWYRNSLVNHAERRGHLRLAEAARSRIAEMRAAETAAEESARNKAIRKIRRANDAARDGIAQKDGPAIAALVPRQAARGSIALIGMTAGGDPHLERWLAYHSQFVDAAHITLLHNGPAPKGSGCNLMPVSGNVWQFADMLATHLTAELGAAAVLPTSQFLTLDPNVGDDPFAFAMAEDARAIIAPMGLDLVHHRLREVASFDQAQPLLSQRQHFQIDSQLSRPAIAKTAASRTLEGQAHRDAIPCLSEELFAISVTHADHDLACRIAALQGGEASKVSRRLDKVSEREAEMREPLLHWAHNRMIGDWLDAQAAKDAPEPETFRVNKKVFRLPERFHGLF